MSLTVPPHAYPGARALILLHETHLRDCLAVWRSAKAAGLAMPVTEDPSYASLEHLLHHVFRAARGYMVWCCKTLELPDPGIDKTPAPEDIEAGADAYIEHLLERWTTPLAGEPEARFNTEAPAIWKVVYCVDAMLEHAVMHPVRHAFQLRSMMGA